MENRVITPNKIVFAVGGDSEDKISHYLIFLTNGPKMQDDGEFDGAECLDKIYVQLTPELTDKMCIAIKEGIEAHKAKLNPVIIQE